MKNHFSFKKRYSISDIGLVRFNKHFLYVTVGAPGSTHDAILLRLTFLFKDILNGDANPDKLNKLGAFGTVPLATVEDNAFNKFA